MVFSHPLGSTVDLSKGFASNSPSHRSSHKTVQTEKFLEVSGNKGKVTKTAVEFLPYDLSKHSSWAKKVHLDFLGAILLLYCVFSSAIAV